MEITPALHDRVTKKFKKISRHSDQLTSASVVLNSNTAGIWRKPSCHCRYQFACKNRRP
ncbi:MAG: HPF/RaiA family ribosome-associated protein [Arenicellales bacterium WSBS_2016_MAG_OTU3]